jgi:hypothetical protein
VKWLGFGPISLATALAGRMAPAQSADRCRDILVYAVQDRLVTASAGSLETAVFDSFCRRTDEQSSSSSGGQGGLSVGLPLDGLPFNLGASGGVSESEAHQRLDAFCRVANAARREANSTFLARVYGAADIVRAYDHCMALRAAPERRGLVVEVESVDDGALYTTLCVSVQVGA